MEVIAIVNQKGGVGKTTSTINLGVALSREDRRVLLIDLDPQSNLTMGLVTPDPYKLTNTVRECMERVIRGSDPLVEDAILTSIEGVDILPSNLDLIETEINLGNAVSRETVLKRLLKPLKNKYDYVLIDCPPSLGIFTLNALTAADSVIVPVNPEYFATKGLELLTRTIRSVRSTLNPKLKIKGILLTMTSSRAVFYKEVRSYVQNEIGRSVPVFASEIPLAVKAAEAPQSQKSIFAHDKNNLVAKAYAATVGEILAKEKAG